MKKLIILLVIIFSFLFSTTSWGDWSYVTESVDGRKFYYDKDRVRKSGKSLYFWMLQEDLKRSKNGIFSITTYTQVDCSIFRLKMLKLHFYKDSMGEGYLDQMTPEGEHGEWMYPSPKSPSETMLNKVCEEHE